MPRMTEDRHRELQEEVFFSPQYDVSVRMIIRECCDEIKACWKDNLRLKMDIIELEQQRDNKVFLMFGIMIMLITVISLIASSLSCETVSPPPVDTTTTTISVIEPQPSDYYTLTRVGTYTANGTCDDHTGLIKEICFELCPWSCWRDPLYVYDYCTNLIITQFLMMPSEMRDFGEVGFLLNDAGQMWMSRLPIVNRRCENDNAWCGRSEVRETVYPNGNEPAFKQWRNQFQQHKSRAMILRDIAQTDPIRNICAYDSIKGWCECRSK